MADINSIVEQLSGLTVLEVADLVKQLEQKWGVSAAAPVAAAAAVEPLLPPPRPPRRRLSSTSSSPRQATTKSASSRKSAPPFPDSASPKPRSSSKARRKPLKTGISKAEAEEIKKKIEAAGAKVEIK